MVFEASIPEETEHVAWMVKQGRPKKREHAQAWCIGKRGTLFSREPDSTSVDLYKDVTHLYRHRESGKKHGRTEWGTTLWIDNALTQVLRSATEEAALTRLHYQRCGYDSIQWGAVELRENRVWNIDRSLRYPLVSEDLWNKHLGSKRQPELIGMKNETLDLALEKKVPSGDEDANCVKLAHQHAKKLHDDGVLTKLLEKASKQAKQT